MEFFNQTGPMAIGSRLRLLTDQITDEASNIYQLYNIDLKAKWFPVFFVLAQGESKSITTLAKEIGHSHPSVSKIIKEMATSSLIEECADPADGRRNQIKLSVKGQQLAKKLEDQYADMTIAIEKILQKTTHNLWLAIDEWEFLLAEKSLLKRVAEEKKMRESQQVRIVPYNETYRDVFKVLNETWITTYFEMEDADHKALDNPQQTIINQGGYIFVALYQGVAVGVCALIKLTDTHYDFELAKMAVSPNAQGKSIGYLLGEAAIQKAQQVGAKKLYLESNTMLKPAIGLYQKLGFKKVVGHATPYKRCNIQMEKIVQAYSNVK